MKPEADSPSDEPRAHSPDDWSLDETLDGVTAENRHSAIDWGAPISKECGATHDDAEDFPLTDELRHLLRSRIEAYRRNPELAIPFDEAIEQIERSLDANSGDKPCE